MAISQIHVEWLDPGGLAILEPWEREDEVVANDFQTPNRVLHAQYLTPGEEGAQPWWRLAHMHHRCVVPVNFDGNAAHFETWLPRLITQASQALEEWGPSTLVLAVRSTVAIDGDPYAMFGLAYVQGCHFPSAASVTGDVEAIAVVLDWIRGIRGQDFESIHAATRGAVERAMARREAEDARRDRIAQLLHRLSEQDRVGYAALFGVFLPNPVTDGDEVFLQAVQQAVAEQTQHADRIERAALTAKALLESCLDPAQHAEFVEHGDFHVVLRDGRRFRIAARQHGNVLEIIDGKPSVSYCIVTADYVPLHDQMLAQKLMLETNPALFFQLANRQEMRTEEPQEIAAAG